MKKMKSSKPLKEDNKGKNKGKKMKTRRSTIMIHAQDFLLV